MPKLTQPDSEELLAVTQGDRKAAADHGLERGLIAPKDVPHIMAGSWDDWNPVQAFARHAQSARIEGREEAARLCDAFVTPFGRAGSQPDAVEGQMREMAVKIRALSPSPARAGDDAGLLGIVSHPLHKALRPSAETIAKIERGEQANAAAWVAVKDIPLGAPPPLDPEAGELCEKLRKHGCHALPLAGIYDACRAAASLITAQSARLVEAERVVGALLAHVERMQGMVEAYLVPKTYVAMNGMMATFRDLTMRDKLFIADMIYMLDGPEQRAAQEPAARWLTPDPSQGSG